MKNVTVHEDSERGAALIITVIVIMVLSILGLTMVTFSSTEERTATSYRDGLQARAIAEAGVHVVEEMFRNPIDRNLVPLFSSVSANCSGGTPPADYCGSDEGTTETSLNSIGIWRASRSPIAPARYTGLNNRFFIGPFRDAWGQTFGGTYNSDPALDKYDLKFNCNNPADGSAVANCWLNTKINSLFVAGGSDYNLLTGRITDISFYAPPSTGGTQYGITTVRVTAVKIDNQGVVVARETIEAVIGDNNLKPAVLGNGDITFVTGGGHLCGNGCEKVHSNGVANVGSANAGSGPDPIVTSVEPIPGGDTGVQQGGQPAVQSPRINPWDLAYRPTNATDYGKYYLAAARRLDFEWRDLNAATPSAANKAPRACGVGGLSLCQDYGLEYIIGTTTAKAARTNTDNPYMYKWRNDLQEWEECDDGPSDLGATCSGAPTFDVTPVDDDTTGIGFGDDADLPFNKNRVAQTVFALNTPANGATVLIDGRFSKHGGGLDPHMAVITAGSQSFTASTTWYPPSSTFRVMWISGRDIYIHANCCAPSNTCSTNLANMDAQGIIAVHEQLDAGSQTTFAGIIISECTVDYDSTVVKADKGCIFSDKGDHAYVCGVPDWPWSLPTIPKIFSLKTVE